MGEVERQGRRRTRVSSRLGLASGIAFHLSRRVLTRASPSSRRSPAPALPLSPPPLVQLVSSGPSRMRRLPCSPLLPPSLPPPSSMLSPLALRSVLVLLLLSLSVFSGRQSHTSVVDGVLCRSFLHPVKASALNFDFSSLGKPADQQVNRLLLVRALLYRL